MKLQLDFDLKTILIEDDVNLGEFIKKIKKVIPEWKEWSFKTNTTINYNSYPWYYWDNNHWFTNPIVYGTSGYAASGITLSDVQCETTTFNDGMPFATLTSGTFNAVLN